MKKFLNFVFSVIIIISLVYLYKNTDILDFIKYEKVTNIDKEKYINNSYYKNLDDVQKEIYAYIAKSVENLETDVKVKFSNSITTEEIQDVTNMAIEAYRYDYPQVFYLDSSYEIKMTTYSSNTSLNITLSYTENSISEIKQKQTKIDQKVQKIINENIDSGMSDYDKELAIHDYLARSITYYKYSDINNIPSEMHNAYNAIINNEAVCDGISKAFQIIMDRLGIECITVSGSLEGVSHAWNIVKIKNKYYHVDITSDKYITKDENHSGVIHAYFNINDERMSFTHYISSKYIVPQCNSTESEYYNDSNTIKSGENFQNKLYQIVQSNTNKDVLEIKIEDRDGAASNLINYLYNMNFDNYKGRNVTSLKYSLIRNIYIIPIGS